MKVKSQTGLFGKLPAHGDFIMRNLPSAFIHAWDEWMQHYIAGTKEQMGEEWLDIYLTSPIWRFVFSSGVIDENVWAGIMLPSVDRVGRYYPFSIAAQLPNVINPFEFIAMQTLWFESIENLALLGLNGDIQIDGLVKELDNIELNYTSLYNNQKATFEQPALQVNMDFEEQLPVSVYCYMLDPMCQKMFSSYGVWTTSGSERINPCMFISQGLPALKNAPAMMNGNWQEWGWTQPYILNHMGEMRMPA